MIVKTNKRKSIFGSDVCDLKIIDKNGKEFIMTVGGNQDLFWRHDSLEENEIFYVDKSDEVLYSTLEDIFKKVKKNDNKYKPTLDGNTFTFVSEDYPEELANKLQIVKEKSQFKITFMKNNQDTVGRFRRGCSICFCNSGSRVPDVEILFMLAFNDLAYFNDEIEQEKE